MADAVTSSFPKMGDDGMASLCNMSGARSPYTMPQARKGPGSPDMGGGNGSSRRGSTEIREAHGPTFRPMATRGWASPYPETARAIRTVPSSVGNRDFWSSRASSGEGYGDV